MRRIFEERMRERQEFLDHYFVFRDTPMPKFEPTGGAGLLAAIQTSYRDVIGRRTLEDPAPLAAPPAHTRRPALDLPSNQLPSPEESPVAPNVNPTPAPRTVERIER
jgi:hypothetical protein